MANKEKLEQKKLELEFRLQEIEKALKVKEKEEKEKARKQDRHFKIIMGGGLYGGLKRYLNKDESSDVIEWFQMQHIGQDGNTYTLADKLLEYIEGKNKEREIKKQLEKEKKQEQEKESE